MLYFTIFTFLIILIILYGAYKKEQGRIEERGKIEKVNSKQLRKEAELRRRLNELTEKKVNDMLRK